MKLRWTGAGNLVRRRVERALSSLDSAPDVNVLYVTRYRPQGTAARTLAELAVHAPVVVLVRDWDLDEARAACAAGAIACLEANAAPDLIADVISEAGAVVSEEEEEDRRPSSRRAVA